MSIVTKKGDLGETFLFSGEKISKSDPRVEAYGTADELGAVLGLARSMIEDKSLSDEVRNLQISLSSLCAELATSNPDNSKWVIRKSTGDVEKMDLRIAELESEIKLPKSFCVAGACKSSAAIEVARTVARRLERKVVALKTSGEKVNDECLTYLNRISDYRFLLARKAEVLEKVPFDTVEK